MQVDDKSPPGFAVAARRQSSDADSLTGFTVGITADRGWEEQAELLRERGAHVLHGPTIRTLPVDPDRESFGITRRLLQDPPHCVAATTRIGMRAFISTAGAYGEEIPVYRWTLPTDLNPAHDLIEAVIAGALQAVTFTSAPAIRNLFLIARGMGFETELRTALNGRVVPMTVGPACAAAAREVGIESPLRPPRPRIDLMICTLIDSLSKSGLGATIGGTPVAVNGNELRIGAQASTGPDEIPTARVYPLENVLFTSIADGFDDFQKLEFVTLIVPPYG